MTVKSNSRTLFVYTSLIFIVAIAMIIISFFAQTHLDNAKIGTDNTEMVSLSNKAAQVSEENMKLIELNTSLQDEKSKLSEENKRLTAEAENAKKELDSYAALFDVASTLFEGNTEAARVLLGNIYTEDLTPEQKEIYDILFKKTEQEGE